MHLYRLAPEGFYAVAELGETQAHILLSDPYETHPDDWRRGQAVDLAKVGLLAPVHPGKIVGIGRNYLEHAKELNNPMPSEPLLFSPFLPDRPQRRSSRRRRAGGARGGGRRMRRRLSRGATASEARAAVLGVTANDVTARDLQKRDATLPAASVRHLLSGRPRPVDWRGPEDLAVAPA
jgi:2-keto-4-pentenoate hydratase/2-oxohepta-3-ene-1,7-dioic acid hydratase in catechol pathway